MQRRNSSFQDQVLTTIQAATLSHQKALPKAISEIASYEILIARHKVNSDINLQEIPTEVVLLRTSTV